jgi:hypothetical protein
MSKDPNRTPPGPGVDAAGAAVKDPTVNVLNLVSAENRRQDDLREMATAHQREVSEIRSDCQKDELDGIQHIEQLRASHARELRLAEADRINAIRAVDVQQVQQAAQVQDTRATALAGQVADAAEAMRQQVAATATASATALATALQPITTSIEQLRQAMYEAAGQKTQVVETQARGANSGLWWGVGIAAFFGFVMFIMAVITVAALVTNGFTK